MSLDGCHVASSYRPVCLGFRSKLIVMLPYCSTSSHVVGTNVSHTIRTIPHVLIKPACIVSFAS